MILLFYCQQYDYSEDQFYETFTSVLKAKLICKKSGSLIPVYYDEIRKFFDNLFNFLRKNYRNFVRWNSQHILFYYAEIYKLLRFDVNFFDFIFIWYFFTSFTTRFESWQLYSSLCDEIYKLPSFNTLFCINDKIHKFWHNIPFSMAKFPHCEIWTCYLVYSDEIAKSILVFMN